MKSHARRFWAHDPYSSVFHLESCKYKSLPLNHIDLSCLWNFQGGLRRPAICILITYISFREMMCGLPFQMPYFGHIQIAFLSWKLSCYSLRDCGNIISQPYQDAGLRKKKIIIKIKICILAWWKLFSQRRKKNPKHWKFHWTRK